MNKIKSIFTFIFSVWLFIQNVIIFPLKKVYIFCRPALVKYKNWFNEFTHDKYGDFNHKRGVAFIGATILSLWLSLVVLDFIFDVVYYYSTKKVETIWLSDSVELEDGLWSAKGCPEKDCNSENALYFRIKNTWFNNIWNIWHHGQIFFPDGIAAGVPTGQTECKVISYGLRYRLIMIFNYYPQILEVHCQSEK